MCLYHVSCGVPGYVAVLRSTLFICINYWFHGMLITAMVLNMFICLIYIILMHACNKLF